jgi:hypothetical protein
MRNTLVMVCLLGFSFKECCTLPGPLSYTSSQSSADSTPIDYTTPFVLTMIVRVLIMISTLSDLMCFIYIWITLRGYRESYYASPKERMSETPHEAV